MKVKPAARLRVVLLADDVTVAEIDDPTLWRRLLDDPSGVRRQLEVPKPRAAPTPHKEHLRRLTNLAVLAPDEATFLETVMTEIAAAYQIDVNVLRGPSRVKCITDARRAAMYILRQHTTMTFQAIGTYFNRHHTTVIDAVNDLEVSHHTDPVLRELLHRFRGYASSATALQ